MQDVTQKEKAPGGDPRARAENNIEDNRDVIFCPDYSTNQDLVNPPNWESMEAATLIYLWRAEMTLEPIKTNRALKETETDGLAALLWEVG